MLSFVPNLSHIPSTLIKANENASMLPWCLVAQTFGRLWDTEPEEKLLTFQKQPRVDL